MGLMNTLNSDILVLAYSQGFFPMPHPETEEICWFNPDPRAIIPLDQFHASRSLKRSVRKQRFTFSIDQAFSMVMAGCADRNDTWINKEIKSVYEDMFRRGLAHSFEVWQDGQLVGGLYGVSLGRAFFAESKFHKATDASKAALWVLVETLNELRCELLEVQFLTRHLASLGAVELSNFDYQKRLSKALTSTVTYPKGQLEAPL